MNHQDCITTLKSFAASISGKTFLDTKSLTTLASEALKAGSLKMARAALTILLSQSKDAEEAEALCEQISNDHNHAKEKSKDLLNEIWQRDLNTYSNSEQINLIKALLIHEQSRLADIIIDNLNITDALTNAIVKLEVGRIKLTPSRKSKKLANNDETKGVNEDDFWLLCDEDYPVPSFDIKKDRIDYLLNSINPEQIYFNAHLIPKRVLIPINAFDNEKNEYNFDSPAIDSASLLWEQSMAEAPHWKESIQQKIHLVNENNEPGGEEKSQTTWPSNVKPPKEIICRIGMPSIIDSIWHNELLHQKNLYLINDYCPSAIIEEVIRSIKGDIKEERIEENVAKFATHTAYLFKLAGGKTLVDISPANLLHLPITLNLPNPVKFAIIDFEPEELRFLVKASCFSNCPYPIPFLFEEDILLEICKYWKEANTFAKENINHSRLTIINHDTLSSQTNEQKSLLASNGQSILGITDKTRAIEIHKILKAVND